VLQFCKDPFLGRCGRNRLSNNEVAENMCFLDLNFLQGGGPKNVYGSLLPWFTRTVW